MVEIIPGILEQKLEVIEEKIALYEKDFNWIQIDLLDNSLFSNQTYTGVDAFRKLGTSAKLELHLMVNQPSQWLTRIPKPPFQRIISHIEAEEPFEKFYSASKEKGFEIGIALDLPTRVDKIEPYLAKIDLVLVMTIKTGFSGQPFAEEALEKVSWLSRRYPDLPIEVDGGMNPERARRAVEAGATRILSTSYIAKVGPQEALKRFQEALASNLA